jgi:Helix-turn-helix domain/Domain of unknown function (DUF397)
MAAARKGRDKDRDSLALFADELKAHRAARGWTQADVAAKTSYSESLVAQVEARFKAASPDLAKALDRAFSTPGFTEDDGGEPGRPGTFGRIVVRLRNLPFPASCVVLVRDTKDRDGAVIEFSAGAWQKFAATLKNGSVA